MVCVFSNRSRNTICALVLEFRRVLFLSLYPQAVSTVVGDWDERTVQAQFRLHLVDEDRTVLDTYPPPELPFDDGDVRPRLLRCGRYRTTVRSEESRGGKAFVGTCRSRVWAST